MFRYGEGGISFPFAFPQPFRQSYKCYCAAMLETDETRERVERGDKIIMPSSALHALTQRHVQYPMLFKVSNIKLNRTTHCGVLEFIAEEGHVHFPSWMMHNLLLGEGDLVTIENVTLPTATNAVFQPQSVDFLDVSNPKAVLEVALRNYTCLSEGDVIAIPYNVTIGSDKKNVQKTFELLVVELKPERAVSIIECDMAVDFRAPPGYDEKRASASQAAASSARAGSTNAPQSGNTSQRTSDDGAASKAKAEESLLNNARVFVGAGHRPDGKSLTDKQIKEQNDAIRSAAIRNGDAAPQRGLPDYDWQVGKLRFWRDGPAKAEPIAPASAAATAAAAAAPLQTGALNAAGEFKPFQSGGISLRDARKNDERSKSHTKQ